MNRGHRPLLVAMMLLPLGLPLAGCGRGADEAEMKRIKRDLAKYKSRAKELQEKLEAREKEVDELKRLRLGERPGSGAETLPAGRPTADSTALLETLIRTAPSFQFLLRRTTSTEWHNGVVITSDTGQPLLLTRHDVYEKDGNIVGQVRSDLLGEGFVPPSLQQKKFRFGPVEVVGSPDEATGLLLLMMS